MGGLAAALSTAAGLLLVISSSLAHDIYGKFIKPGATESQRLLVGRMMIFAAVVMAGYFGINPPGFVAEVVAFAFGLAAASFFPVILLGIFDKRTNRTGALLGMIVGIGFTGFYIIGNRFFGMPAFFFGIGAQGIGTIGMIFNLVVTYVVSRLTAPPPLEIQDLVESVRIPRGASAASAHQGQTGPGSGDGAAPPGSILRSRPRTVESERAVRPAGPGRHRTTIGLGVLK